MTSGPAPEPAVPRVGAVVVAAGKSTRMAGVDKTFTEVLGRPLVAHTLAQFERSSLVDDVVLVVAREHLDQGRRLVEEHHLGKVSSVCAGGDRRQDSVKRGLEALGPCHWVIVHDGARPVVDQQMLERGLAVVRETGAAVAGVPVKDTVKVVSPDRVVLETPERDALWAAQTPQIFRYELLQEAHRRCGHTVTDDAAMAESLGYSVKMFLGSYQNIKVTTPEDLVLVEAFLASSPSRRPGAFAL